MRKISLLIISLFISTSLLAQWGPPGGGGGNRGERERTPANRQQNTTIDLDSGPKGNSKISGSLVDESFKIPVEFATVSLIDATTKKTIDGAMADENGKFELKKVAEGTYNLVASFIGYESKTIEKVKVEKGKDVDLGDIKMKPSSITLDAVVVSGEKALIEEKVDRLVYNAEKDLTSIGGDASDVLKNVPMLSVDLDGNVALRGSENIQVLINNKPSTIVASSIADALKMIPSDLIKTVEVITSPSARYDAEGTAGIINIILKKSTLKGLNLNLNTGVGNRASNLGLNGNYRTGKLGVTFGGFGRMHYNRSKNVGLNENFVSGLMTDQLSTGRTNGLFGRYNIGFDYDLGNSQSLNAGVALGTRGFNRYNDQYFNYFQKVGGNYEPTRKELRDQDALNNTLSWDFNLDYTKIFKPGSELYISTLYSRSNTKSDNYTNFLDLLNNGNITQKQWNDNDNLNTEFTGQIDYVRAVGQNQQLEVGAKAISRSINSLYLYYLSDSTTSDLNRLDFLDLPLDKRNPGGGLNYDQTIYATYAAYTYSTKNKFTLKAGARFEYTTLEAQQSVNRGLINSEIQMPVFKDSYPVIVPSINISKPLGKVTSKLSYNYRISRPGMRQINPNVDISDPLNVRMGNPLLDPEKTHNTELSFSLPAGKSYFTFSTFGRYSNNSMTSVSMTARDAALLFKDIPELANLNESAIVNTSQNIGKETSFGANLFGNIVVSPKLSFNANIDGFHMKITGFEFVSGVNRERVNNGFSMSTRLTANLKIDNKWSVQANGGWRGRRISLQGENSGMPNYALAVRYEASKNMSFGLGADNFLGGIKMSSTTSNNILYRTNTNYMYNQNIRLNFTYKLGNMKFVQSKKKGISNDDSKGGDDD